MNGAAATVEIIIGSFRISKSLHLAELRMCHTLRRYCGHYKRLLPSKKHSKKMKYFLCRGFGLVENRVLRSISFDDL